MQNSRSLKEAFDYFACCFDERISDGEEVYTFWKHILKLNNSSSLNKGNHNREGGLHAETNKPLSKTPLRDQG